MKEEILLKKLERIENMLVELNTKFENFLGYEELSDEESKEIDNILKEVKEGKYYTFEDVFGEE